MPANEGDIDRGNSISGGSAAAKDGSNSDVARCVDAETISAIAGRLRLGGGPSRGIGYGNCGAINRAALRIKNYKNFLRLKFEPDKLTIYPLGIDKMPGPDHWMNAPRGKANPMPNNPKLIAVKPIDVHLIETPIVILCDDVTVE